jgi:hypothetical protein
MSKLNNPLMLASGTKYKVVKAFTDYARNVHPVDETWTFLRTNFLPYEDGLTLHVQLENAAETAYLLQWRPEEQAYIIEHFREEFVRPC